MGFRKWGFVELEEAETEPACEGLDVVKLGFD